MAQHNNKKENTELQFTESLTLTLCSNNCGLHGNPATGNMCSACFHSKIRPESSSGSGHGAVTRPDPVRPAERPAATERTAPQLAEATNRCVRCRKRVGLTGFRCRCGDLFCGDHRYSDRHDCGFDYKAIERERIRMENPLVRAAKVVRI